MIKPIPEGATELVISRFNDPEWIRIPVSAISGIPETSRRGHQESFISGGLSFYAAEAANVSHHSERGEHFLFSVSMEYVRANLPEEILKQFEFPTHRPRPAVVMPDDEEAAA